jgi:hypothetical protein
MLRSFGCSVAFVLAVAVAAPPAAAESAADPLGLLGGHWRCADAHGAISTRSSLVGRRRSDALTTAAKSRTDIPLPDGTTESDFERIRPTGVALALEGPEGNGNGRIVDASTVRFEGRDGASGAPFVLTYVSAPGQLRRTVTSGAATLSDVRCTAELPTPAPASCAMPNVPARTIETVVPFYPAEAVAQHVTGNVQVILSLDDRSNVIWADVFHADSPLLVSEALRTARGSTFATEVVHCRPLPEDYIFTVSFRRR